MEFLRRLLSHGGGISTMRVMGFWSLAIGSLLALYGVYKGLNLLELSALCGVFVGAAFGGKVAQKRVETDKTQE